MIEHDDIISSYDNISASYDTAISSSFTPSQIVLSAYYGNRKEKTLYTARTKFLNLIFSPYIKFELNKKG